jgi:predicted RNA binding protein YcfA (HicA-like mRNA interferase family)
VVGQELVKVREILKLIERDGWRYVRQKGSHATSIIRSSLGP